MIARWMLVLAVCSFSLLAGCSGQQDGKLPPPPMNVSVSVVELGNIEQTLDVSGTLNYVANTTVSAEVSGQVKALEVEDGQPVEAGQLLLVFDETKIQATADQAQGNLQRDEATLAFNKTEWEKNLELLKSGAVSQTQYDQKFSSYRTSLGQVDADRAALAKAAEDLKKTKVLAPKSGVLSDRYVERGDWISEGGQLFQISDFSKIRLEAFISDLDVGKLNVKKAVTEGVDAEVTVDSYPGRPFKGKLTYIQPIANQSRLFQIRIYLENPDMMLLQGMFARGRIVVKTIPGVVRVPITALLEQVRENEANMVFLVDPDQKARLLPIKIGQRDPLYAEVLEGLSSGNKVVVQGKEILSSGQPLKTTLLPPASRNGQTAPKQSSSRNETAQDKSSPKGSMQ
jgi:RND family efflux transporter MFP subunit